ncbi:MAG: hypothetical protein ACRESX_00525 [Gammaproteobacteria bacterium]
MTKSMEISGALPIGATLSEAWSLFLKSLPMIFLPLWIACIVDVVPDAFAGGGLLTGSITWTTFLVTILAWLVESALFGGAIAKLDAYATGSMLSYGQAMRIGMRAAPAILIGDLLYNIASWVGFLFFIVPGIILGTTLAFFAYAAVLDRKNVLDVLGYSHLLTWPHWWRTSVVISVPAIVLFIYDVVAGWPDIMSAVHQLGAGKLPSASSLANPWYDYGLMPLAGGIVWCYALSVCYLQYRKLKARAGNH